MFWEKEVVLASKLKLKHKLLLYQLELGF